MNDDRDFASSRELKPCLTRLTRRREHREGKPVNVEEVSAVVVDAAFHLHRNLGPGLLESVYEAVLSNMLEKRGLRVERQKAIAFEFEGLHFNEGLRVDILVEGCLVVELKSVENLAPVHSKQVLTCLRLLKLPLGLLINFGAATFKEGIKRIVNNHRDFASSREPDPCLTRLARRREDREGVDVFSFNGPSTSHTLGP